MPWNNTQETFWSLVAMRPGCWLWQGRISKITGYGRFCYQGKEYQAHRLAVIFTEPFVPKSLVVMHACDRKECVNPFHLRLGTQSENVKDMYRKGRHCYGESVHNSKLTEQDVRDIRRRYVRRVFGYRKLAKEFGVSTTTILKIVRRQKWRHVDES